MLTGFVDMLRDSCEKSNRSDRSLTVFSAASFDVADGVREDDAAGVCARLAAAATVLSTLRVREWVDPRDAGATLVTASLEDVAQIEARARDSPPE